MYLTSSTKVKGLRAKGSFAFCLLPFAFIFTFSNVGRQLRTGMVSADVPKEKKKNGKRRKRKHEKLPFAFCLLPLFIFFFIKGLLGCCKDKKN